MITEYIFISKQQKKAVAGQKREEEKGRMGEGEKQGDNDRSDIRRASNYCSNINQKIWRDARRLSNRIFA
jgi:hypothetical protein